MNEVLDRAAKAIAKRRMDENLVEAGKPPAGDAVFDVIWATVRSGQTDQAKSVYASYVEDARAVIVALREPSAAMIEAGWEADIPGGRFGEPTFRESTVDENDVPVIWKAMLDKAMEPLDG